MKRLGYFACAISGAALFGASFGAHAQSTTRSALGSGFYNCKIVPLRVVELSASIDGIISTVVVKPGDAVKEGDVIAKMDDALLQSEFELAKIKANSVANLEGALGRMAGLEKRTARLQRGFQRKAVSASDLDAAKLDLQIATSDVARERDALKMAKAELVRSEVYLDRLVLRSPVDGIVGEDIIDPGESVAKRHVATIYVNRPLRVEAFVAANDIVDFTANDAPEIVVNGNLNEPVPVEFDYAAQVADLASNTISVFFTLDATNVLPGSKCVIGKGGS